MRRYRKRPFPTGAEPETKDLVPPKVKPAKQARTLIPDDSSTPYFEQLVDEALDAARRTEERPVFNVVKATRPL